MTFPLIVAHRGALSGESENSLESFERAIALGADMIEFDLRKTKDDVLAAHHDAALGDVAISDLTFQELNKLKPDVPRLEEIIEMTEDRIALDIELKEHGFEEKVINLLKQHRAPEDVVITSFNEESVRRIKELQPSQRAGLLLSPSIILRDYFRLSTDSILWKKIKSSNADFIAPHHRFVNDRQLMAAKALDLPVYVWTVNNSRKIQKLLMNKAVAAIITDRTDLALSIRNAFENGGEQKAAS